MTLHAARANVTSLERSRRRLDARRDRDAATVPTNAELRDRLRPSPGRLTGIEEFEERPDALRRRFTIELENGYDGNVEVVILAAPSKDDLLRTHGRYFKSLAELAS